MQDFEEKRARKIFVVLPTRNLALHFFPSDSERLFSLTLFRLSQPRCSGCMVGPDGAVAFFLWPGVKPSPPLCQSIHATPCHCLDYSSLLASPARWLYLSPMKMVGTQFFGFSRSPEKVWRYDGEQLDASTYCPILSKTKNQPMSDLPIRSWRIVGAQLVTLSFSTNGRKTSCF